MTVTEVHARECSVQIKQFQGEGIENINLKYLFQKLLADSPAFLNNDQEGIVLEKWGSDHPTRPRR